MMDDFKDKGQLQTFAMKQMIKSSNAIKNNGEHLDINNQLTFKPPSTSQAYINEKAFVLGKTRSEVKKL